MQFSDAEEAIRADVVERLREGWPGCRIIHELNVEEGSRRLDVAAITSDRIVGVEIKSEKDTLNRLEGQIKTFSRSVDALIVVAHPKHWVMGEDRFGGARLTLGGDMDVYRPCGTGLVCWSPKGEPFPFDGAGFRKTWFSWDVGRYRRISRHPEAGAVLNLLWREELVVLARRLRVSHAARATKPTIIAEIRWHASLKEIKHGVCAALRSRRFARADDPVREASHAA